MCIACSRLSDSGADAKAKGTRKVGGAVSSRFVFVFARSLFSGPDSEPETGSSVSGAPNDNFRKNICSEDDLRSRIFGTFVVKFLACLPLLGFSNI